MKANGLAGELDLRTNSSSQLQPIAIWRVMAETPCDVRDNSEWRYREENVSILET
jgi:hypothetical protein